MLVEVLQAIVGVLCVCVCVCVLVVVLVSRLHEKGHNFALPANLFDESNVASLGVAFSFQHNSSDLAGWMFLDGHVLIKPV